MSNIYKCPTTDCPVRLFCYRFTAFESDFQNYLDKEVYKIDDNKFSCDMIWNKNAESIIEEVNELLKENS